MIMKYILFFKKMIDILIFLNINLSIKFNKFYCNGIVLIFYGLFISIGMMVNPDKIPKLKSILQITGFLFGKNSAPILKFIMASGSVVAFGYEFTQDKLQKRLDTSTPVLTHMIEDFFMKPTDLELIARYSADIENSETNLQKRLDLLDKQHRDGKISFEVYLQKINYYKTRNQIKIDNFMQLSEGDISISQFVGSHLSEYMENRIKNSPAYSATMPNSAAEGLVRAGNELGGQLQV